MGFMAFLLKQKLLEDLWLCFALILGNISSHDFLVLCLAACRLVCSNHKSHSQDAQDIPLKRATPHHPLTAPHEQQQGGILYLMKITEDRTGAAVPTLQTQGRLRLLPTSTAQLGTALHLGSAEARGSQSFGDSMGAGELWGRDAETTLRRILCCSRGVSRWRGFKMLQIEAVRKRNFPKKGHNPVPWLRGQTCN